MNFEIGSDQTRRLFFRLIAVSAVLGTTAFLMLLLDTLSPSSAFWSSHVAGQLRAFGETTLLYFVVLPLLPLGAGAWKHGSRFPKWAFASWLFFLAGGLFLVFALLTGSMRVGWMFAAASPLPNERPAFAQLFSILSVCLGLMIMAILWRLEFAKRRANLPVFEHACGVNAARLMMVALPLVASPAFFAVKDRFLGMPLLEIGGVESLKAPAYPVVAGLGMLHVAMGLMVCAWISRGLGLGDSLPRRLSLLPMLLAGLSLFSPEVAMLPSDLPFLPLFGATFFHAMSTAVWLLLLFQILVHLPSRVLTWKLESAMLLSSGVFFMFALFAGFFLNLVTVSGGFSFGYLVQARRFLLGGALAFSLLAPMQPKLGRDLAAWTTLLSGGFVGTFLLLLGGTGTPAHLAVYPEGEAALQFVLFLSALVFTIGASRLVLPAIKSPLN